jgi:hypothetical protein
LFKTVRIAVDAQTASPVCEPFPIYFETIDLFNEVIA